MISPFALGCAHQPDPHQDQPGQPTPGSVQEILTLARILIEYGHHLAALMPMGAVWSGFATVARFLGGDTLTETLFRIQRGLLRAIALERVLLRRAQRGRDLSVFPSRIPLGPATPGDHPILGPAIRDPHANGAHIPGTHADAQPAAPPGCSDDPYADDPYADDPGTLPSLEELEAEIRRRPIGRTLAAICLDLGVSPSLCTGWFWNRLFQAMITYQGNLVGLLTELNRRQLSFEQTHQPQPPHRPVSRLTQGTVRNLLGFFIGEPADLPPWPPALPGLAVTTGTGPP